MVTGTDSETPETPSPQQAFALLGDETRLEILQVLGGASAPLSFSELYSHVDYQDSSNFGYHLQKLVGHFVSKTPDGYSLRQPGRRVIEAVLSGAVTANPILEPTTVDRPCPFCGHDVQIAYNAERIALHCPHCAGFQDFDGAAFEPDIGNLGHLLLPPAGVHNRTPDEILRAAEVWSATEVQSVVLGVCRRCSARVEQSIHACDSHDPDGSKCSTCGLRFGVMFQADCTNCPFSVQAPLVTYLAGQPELMTFMLDHGIDPYSQEAFVFPTAAVEETLVSTDPFEAHYVFTADSETLALTVEDGPRVTRVDRQDSSN